MRISVCLLAAVGLALVVGCEPSIEQMHREGISEFRAGRPEQAIGMFQGVRERDPSRADTLYYLGRCYTALAQRYYDKGDLAAALGRLQLALFYYDSAIQSFPGYTDALEAKNRALEVCRSWESALDVAQWASRQAGPQAKYYIFLAHEMEQRKDFDGAWLAYKQAAQIEPDNATAHAELGTFYMRMGDDASARQELMQASLLNPSEPGVADALAQLAAGTTTESQE
jgi:tetratricopeptide (TPR) repeat protein